MTRLRIRHHFFTILVCILSTVWCSSSPIAGASQNEDATITVERAIHFLNAEDTDVVVPPKDYAIHADPSKELLFLKPMNGGQPIQITAQGIKHEEQILTATPLSFSEKDDEHRLLLLQPDGTGLEAIGSYSGIHSRASRQTRNRTSHAVIKQQFNRVRLTSRARLALKTHFTLRVPIQLNNLNPDIDKFKIRCWTHMGNDATKPDKRIGEGETVAHVSNRKFHGTIVVKFNAKKGKEPEAANSYACLLLFHKPGIGFRQPAKYGSSSANAKPAWLVSSDGTDFVRSVAGVNLW